MPYRRSASALLLSFLAVAALPLVAQTKVSEGYVDAGDGVRLFYRLLGPGRDTLVIIHGGPGLSFEYFGHELDPLASRGHALLFYDQRGAGRSTLVHDSAGLQAPRFADDLEAVRRHFKLESLNTLSHSWGPAVVALYATSRRERLGRTILLDAIPLRMSELQEAFRQLAAGRDSASRRRLEEAEAAMRANPEDRAACRRYHAIWFGPFFIQPGGPASRRLEACSGSGAALRNSAENVDRYTFPSLGDYDWRRDMARVRSPTLVMHGDKDFIPVATAREWAATMPDARLFVMRGYGHFPYMEAPEPFFAAVDRFLNGGWPQGAEVVH
ncbi:MAG TPA: alpha/beta fold hydrolase [Gemmatimonadales bacterium]|jgi:proline iminopeptidase